MSEESDAAYKLLAEHLQDLSKNFEPGTILTLIARNPNIPEGDMVVSADTPDGIQESINRMRARIAAQGN